MKLSELPYLFCGVYCIVNTVTDTYYIGCSWNIGNRLSEHVAYLMRGRHDNKPMQTDYQNHGLASFEFYVLEQCSEDEAKIKESEWVYRLSGAGIKLYNRISHLGTFYSVLKQPTE